MLVEPFRISVFKTHSNKKDITFSTVIKNTFPISSLEESQRISDSFANYVAEEIEIACGCGTNSALIMSGESADVQKICKCLSPAVKKSIIGITPKGYNPTLWKEVLKLSLGTHG